MNDNDLERELRSQFGPREQGYRPAALPAEPGAPSHRPGVPPMLRGGLFAAVAAAAVLAVVIVSGGLDGRFGVGGDVSTPSPTDAKTQAATPSVAPSSAAEPAACRPEDVVLTAEPWGGAAGSRGTSVTLALADGAPACHPTNTAFGRILDATGAMLVESIPEATDLPLLTLQPGAKYQVGVAWSNWCGAHPVGIRLELRLGNWSDWVAVQPHLPGTGGPDPVPPCIGDGGTSLSVTEVQSAP
ncbi:MAG: hypothetical protein ABI864_01470 [Chloroflexota bacterium]